MSVVNGGGPPVGGGRRPGRALPDRPRWEVGPAGEQTASSVDSVDGESGFGCRLDELHDVGRVGDHRQMP
jgi:hypothetical protein